MAKRVFTMQDRSGGKINRTDEGLTLENVLYMTDYTDEEFNAIADLPIGETLLVGSAKDISIKRFE